MKVSFVDREVIHPGPHEVRGEDEGNLGRGKLGERLLEDLETPVLALG